MADSDIISRIKYLIKELNFRQTEFAKKIGVDTSNLSKYMNGRLPVSDSLINRIVVNLGRNGSKRAPTFRLPNTVRPPSPPCRQARWKPFRWARQFTTSM